MMNLDEVSYDNTIAIYDITTCYTFYNYSYYKLGGNYNLAFDDISLNNNILSISQASSYNYYVQGIVF